MHVLWMVVPPGAGAREVKAAWGSAPRCLYGLTVMNLNDVLAEEPWRITDEAAAALAELVVDSKNKCVRCADVFVNEPRFFPRLCPEYPELVRQYTNLLAVLQVRVHDGARHVADVKLPDAIHFAVESTEAVLNMYMAAIGKMWAAVRVDNLDAALASPVPLDAYRAHPQEPSGRQDSDLVSEASGPLPVLVRRPDAIEHERVRGEFLEYVHAWGREQGRGSDALEAILFGCLFPTRRLAVRDAADTRFGNNNT